MSCFVFALGVDARMKCVFDSFIYCIPVLGSRQLNLCTAKSVTGVNFLQFAKRSTYLLPLAAKATRYSDAE